MTTQPQRSPLLQDPNAMYPKMNRQDGTTHAIDIGCGLFGPLLASPLVAIVDAAVAKTAAMKGATTVMTEIKSGLRDLFTRPSKNKFIRDPKWQATTALCWMVYAGTYVAANEVTTYSESNHVASHTKDMLMLSATMVANIGLTQVKDGLLVYLNGTGGKSVRTPALSRGLFFIRDASTMLAAFVVAPHVARYIEPKLQLSEKWSSLTTKALVPMALQVLSTIPHLYAFHYANLLDHAKTKQFVRRDYVPAVFARMCRILPAIGFGNNINMELRATLLHRQARKEGQTECAGK